MDCNVCKAEMRVCSKIFIYHIINRIIAKSNKMIDDNEDYSQSTLKEIL